MYPDRSISPKAAEVKAQYAAVRLKISPERRQIQIENRQLFSDLSGLAFVLTVLRNGKNGKHFRLRHRLLRERAPYIPLMRQALQTIPRWKMERNIS